MAVRTHRLHAFAGRLHEVLDDLLGGEGQLAPPVSELTAEQTRETIVELSRAQRRLEALQSRLLVQADRVDVASDAGATGTASWLATAVCTPSGPARGQVDLARRLDARFELTAQALAAGALGVDQARVVADAVDALPSFVGAAERRRAEAHLVSEALHHDARRLRVLGKHLLEVIDPDGADELLAARLAEEEARAESATSLTMVVDHRGTCHGSFRVPALHGAMLSAALEAITSPKRPDALLREEPDVHGIDRPVPRDQLLGRALCELLERLPADRLPRAGGTDATVVVTMTLDGLLGGLGAASLSTGEVVSAGTARRLACQAGIVPVVLGSSSVVLDAGRKVRLHTESMRIALRAQHRTCTAEGCEVPAAWCHAHHKQPWSAGGRTSVADGTLLCPRHHTLVHRPDREVRYLPSGATRITRSVKRRC